MLIPLIYISVTRSCVTLKSPLERIYVLSHLGQAYVKLPMVCLPLLEVTTGGPGSGQSGATHQLAVNTLR